MSATPLTRGVPLAEVTRRDERTGDELVESLHAGHLAVVQLGVGIEASAGDPDALTFVRSTAKPFQTVASLERLGRRGDELSDAEVAVSWGSHRGEPRHLTAVATLLARSGTAPDELTCPPAAAEASPGAVPTPIQHNCSGKHALFALTGQLLGTPRAQLLDPRSRLQQELLEEVSGRLEVVAVGTDGCGAPAVASPLASLAQGYAALATFPWGERVRTAGQAHPLLVGGVGRLESALLATGIVAKVGAEGVYAVGWTDAQGRGWGLAVKATDGATRGVAAATVALLEGLGVVPAGIWSPPPPLGGGQPVGAVRPTRVIAELVDGIGRRAAR